MRSKSFHKVFSWEEPSDFFYLFTFPLLPLPSSFPLFTINPTFYSTLKVVTDICETRTSSDTKSWMLVRVGCAHWLRDSSHSQVTSQRDWLLLNLPRHLCLSFLRHTISISSWMAIASNRLQYTTQHFNRISADMYMIILSPNNSTSFLCPVSSTQ